jgi:serine/threonine protein kinase/tetratricopeptide (TPR) repeat protein
MIGQILGHYRIVSELGAGGMGVVYRAHDEQLDRDVALKILPAGALADEAARNRFRREALALAKLNHPNIETVYEFGSSDGIDYLAMELVPGETLYAKLAAGSLTSRETERLGMQLAEGLDAAHAQGIIHRDLKPGNLMLMPDGRLKILDFGLARLVHPGTEHDIARTISETTSISGTLPYMSPEQLKGLPVDARSDIFAAGAVLYELATARKPFPQSQSAELIGAILHQNPPAVSSMNDRVAPGLAAIIQKCLEKDPQERFQSARELRAALEGASSAVAPPPKAAWRPLLVAAGALLSIVLVVGAILRWNAGGWRDRLLRRDHAENKPISLHPGAVKPRRSIAVLGFKNLSGKKSEAWLSTALSEMLTTELGAGETLRTVPGESVARIKADLDLAEADTFAPDTLTRIRSNLNSDFVVMGSYLPVGGVRNGQLRLDVRLQDAAAGETMALVSDTGSEQNLPDLVLRAGAKLREKLGVGAVPSTEAPAVRSSQPGNQEAARLYAEGIASLRAFDALKARDLLEKAVAADPDFPLGHAALATAWSNLGYDEKAKVESKKAFDLSGKLSREDRLSIEASYRENSKEWEIAQELYRTLWNFFPDNLQYGYALAMAQTSGGKPKEALATVEVMRRIPAPARDDPHVDLAELEAAANMGDLKRTQAAAGALALKGKALGVRRLVAQARIRECLAFRNLGQRAQARAACEEGRQLFRDSRDRNAYAWALNNTGSLEQEVDPAGAKRDLQEALAIYRQIGQKHGEVSVLNNLATGLRDQSKYLEAIHLYEQILPVCQEIGDHISEAIALTNMANSHLGIGDLAGAKKNYEDAVAIYQQLGNKSFEALNSSNLATALLMLGDLNGAKQRLARSQTLLDEIGNKEYRVYVLSGQGDVNLASGDLPAARKKYEEAIAMANALDQKVPAAENQASLAQVAVEEGHPQDATASLTAILATFRAMDDSDDELVSQMALADALLLQSEPAEAQKHLDAVKTLVEKTQDPSVQLQYALTSARVAAANGKLGEALKTLQPALATATKRGFVHQQFELRLALGQTEIKAGQTAAGRKTLASLEKDARARGFLLVANKAAQSQKPVT